MAFARSDDFKAPDSRVSYAFALFKAKPNSQGQLKFNPTLIFPNAMKTAKVISYRGSMLSLEDIVGTVILEQWGEAGLTKARAGLIKSPFIGGDGKEARSKKTGELHPGMGPDVFMIRPTANGDRPPMVSASATAVVPATEKDVYSGCYGFAVLNAFAWHNDQNGDGVSFGIQCFYKKRDGERLGGGDGGDPEKWLETVDNAGGAPDSTKNGAGAGGLFG